MIPSIALISQRETFAHHEATALSLSHSTLPRRASCSEFSFITWGGCCCCCCTGDKRRLDVQGTMHIYVSHAHTHTYLQLDAAPTADADQCHAHDDTKLLFVSGVSSFFVLSCGPCAPNYLLCRSNRPSTWRARLYPEQGYREQERERGGVSECER